MRPAFSEVIKVWRKAHGSNSQETLWRTLVRQNPWVFSHHPSDDCFLSHVWSFRGLYVCKGCMVTLAGMVVAVIVQLLTGWLGRFSSPVIALIFTGLLMPTLLTSFFEVPRIYKHAAKFLLGTVMSSALWLLVITPDWWVRPVIVATYFSVKIPLDRKRRRDNQRLLDSHLCCKTSARKKTSAQRLRK